MTAPGPRSAGPRSGEQRKADVLDKLTHHADVWVASASTEGAHLVPLSLAWDGHRVLLALERTSVTARNVETTGRARLALGETRDVVMIDATLDEVAAVEDADLLAEAYADQADWDPRTAGPGYVFLALQPQRVQAWREADELAGRTLMRAGEWLV